MKAHSWKITHMEEFFRKGLLGMNTNRGWKIQLCLRYHNDENRFLPWEEILGTMLHELAHNIRGPHDEKFYKALNDLNDEYDKVVASGYRGEGFDADGHRLGSRGLRPTSGGFGSGFKDLGAGVRLVGGPVAVEGLVTGGTRAAAVLAAEKRRQKNELMLPAGGRRLGGNQNLASSGGKLNEKGFWEHWHSPGELAALAAEQRAKDQVWCGSSNPSSNNEGDDGATSGSSSPQTSTSSSPSSQKSTGQDKKPTTPTIKPSTATASTSPFTTPRRPEAVKRAVAPVVDLTDDASASASNIPATNKKSKVAPPSPPRTREQTQQDQHSWTQWVCPACTLVNRPLALQCECCFTVRP